MFTPEATNVSFAGKALVLPVVSVGNVPQLTADLLIASLNLNRLGFLDASYLVPAIGGREGGLNGVSTPLEVFGKDDLGIVVVQQRSPVLKAHKHQFIDSLLRWIRTSAFSAVVLLTGIDPTNRTDAQMLSPTYYYLPTTTTKAPPPLSEIVQLLPSFTTPSNAEAKEPRVPSIPGGGLTYRLLSSLDSKWPIPTISLLQFVLEGDNRGDAAIFVALLNRVLKLNLQRVVEPESWKEGLFGTPHDQTMFG